jgi:hypothetical protein
LARKLASHEKPNVCFDVWMEEIPYFGWNDVLSDYTKFKSIKSLIFHQKKKKTKDLVPIFNNFRIEKFMVSIMRTF